MIIRRIEPLSLGKVFAVLYGGLGLLIGALVSIFAVVGSSIAAATEEAPLPFLGVLFGVGAVILLPLLYGVFGFLGGVIWSALYNLAARLAGGIVVQVENA